MFNFFLKNRADKNKQRKIQRERCKSWFIAKGDKTLRLDYDLNKDSVVFDLGGYKGDFAENIYKKYAPNIYIFEPVKSFYSIIKKKFETIEKVKPYHYGLADVDKQLHISLTDDGSSVFIKESKKTETIQLKSLVEFVKNNNINIVDLIKINIEGGEYDVLESLLEENMITRFKNIQVQFHDFIIENATERMENIQKQLAKTHKITYQFNFVWENWQLK